MPVLNTLKAIRVPLALAAMTSMVLGASGCIEDPDCGICDPDNLVLESISGVNYAGRKVHLLNPDCQGDDCPGDFDEGEYFIEEIGLCDETEDANDLEVAARGPDEYCKLAPIAATFGIEFVFNNLLDPESIELVRKRPDNPQLFEVYDWKTRVLEIHGPITRYNGDFFPGEGEKPDRITRSVNLSCIDNLRDQGKDFTHESFDEAGENPCNEVGSNGLPMKMRATEADGSLPIVKSYRGEADWRRGSCDTPDDRPDDCCSVCDYELSVNVAKYGVTQEVGPDDDARGMGVLRNPNVDPGDANAAIQCDPAVDDVYVACRDFIPWVDRSREVREYDFAWTSQDARDSFKIPYYDKLRTTHPEDRPPWLERKTVPCASDNDCVSANAAAMPGTACVGHLEGEDTPCDPTRHDPADPNDTACVEAHCVAEWFVECNADLETTGPQGYCRDKRFYDRGAAACYRATADFSTLDPETGEDDKRFRADDKLAACDQDESGILTAAECCRESLGASSASGQQCTATLPCEDPDDPMCACPDMETCCPEGEVCINNECFAACDPLFQANTKVLPVFERNFNLPETTAGCKCLEEFDGAEQCKDIIDRLCRIDGDPNQPIKPERVGEYAVKLVTKVGGVIYDPAIKGFEWRPGHLGNVQRALIEGCAEDRGLVGKRNIEDGWRANDTFVPHYFEDFDRALCSGQQYEVVFATPESGEDVQYVKDKVDNTLEGKSTYLLETPDFHVIPGSGFPTDNLRIGACEEFSIKFSAKYDMTEENLRKLEIYTADEDGNPEPGGRVAGGLDCSNSPEEVKDGAIPCLTVDVGGQWLGEVTVRIDPVAFGAVLRTDETYTMVVPGLDDIGQMSDPDAYNRAFWDACGMPLVTGGVASGADPDHLYTFTIDAPKCKEDKDRDGVQLSCDNSKDFFNPDQADIDGDFFGDVEDLCPTIPSMTNSGDSDNDGVGNDCDNCRQTLKQYNDDAEDLGLSAYMMVRNIPFQSDTDQDGIGDVCDNCVWTANCEDYGPDLPYNVGDPIKFDDENVCQRDDDSDMIGDQCEGEPQRDEAAGPIGFGDDDDFDQDGLPNLIDNCPRQPVAYQACTDESECPLNSTCDGGVCNHPDSEPGGGDRVGDECDTCPFVANPLQVAEGGMQEDDEDGDFIGQLCESHSSCNKRKDPRPFSFYEVQANGYCCIQQYQGGTIPCDSGADPDDPDIDCPQGYICDDGDPAGPVCNLAAPGPEMDPKDRIPVRFECDEDQQLADECRKLPDSVINDQPGLVSLPPGCDEALAAAGITAAENSKITPDDVGGDLNVLWGAQCFLPPWDQDFDGVGDQCDLCPFDFDSENLQYIDQNGKVWPTAGKFCNGIYDIENVCEAEESGGTGTGTGTGTGGGTGTGSGT